MMNPITTISTTSSHVITISKRNNFFLLILSLCSIAYAVPTKSNLTYHLFQREKDPDRCRQWTFDRALFPSATNRCTHTVLNDNDSAVIQVRWTGRFDGVAIHLPFSSDCTSGSVVPTSSELSAPPTPYSLLCSSSSSSSSTSSATKTVFVDFLPSKFHWNDIIEDDFQGGLNIWHFHAHFFTIWLSFHLIDVTIAHLAQQNILVNPNINTLTPPVDYVLSFPDVGFKRFYNDSSNSVPFVVTPAKLNELHERHGALLTPLTGLQAVADALKPGRVLVTAHSIPMRTLRAAMVDAAFEPRVHSVITPPGRDHMMWELERTKLDMDLPSGASLCNDSVLTHYKHIFLSDTHSQNTHNQQQHPPATHICFMSRQMRSFAHLEPRSLTKVKRRNVAPDTFAAIVKRLVNPLVLSPHIALRIESDAYHVNMVGAPLKEQMQFVHDECAVLVGVHGAGLTHTLALRPGTQLIEMLGRHDYLIFKNTALLMNNVSYESVRLNSSSFVGDELNEHDLRFYSEADLDSFIDLVKRKLRESVRNQMLL